MCLWFWLTLSDCPLYGLYQFKLLPVMYETLFPHSLTNTGFLNQVFDPYLVNRIWWFIEVLVSISLKSEDEHLFISADMISVSFLGAVFLYFCWFSYYVVGLLMMILWEFLHIRETSLHAMHCTPFILGCWSLTVFMIFSCIIFLFSHHQMY